MSTSAVWRSLWLFLIVLPIGTRLAGYIVRLEQPSKTKRTLPMIGGDFSPHPLPIRLFDSIAGPDGQAISTIQERG